VTLIKTVLTSIPIYFFSFFRVPKKVEDKLVSLQRRFLWGGDYEQNKIVWIKWETVCLPKDDGGLGVKDSNSFNLSLLGKWKWDLFQQQGELWASVLESKYGGWRALNEATRDNTRSIWWRDLKKVAQHPQHEAVMKNTTLWKVGCGDKFRFRKDKWIGEEDSLLAKYSRMYSISVQQDKNIQHMGAFKDTSWEWDFRWRRSLFDSEIDMAVAFLKDVEFHRIQPQISDQWVWKAAPSGQYSAKTAYQMLREDISQENQDGAFEELRKLKVP